MKLDNTYKWLTIRLCGTLASLRAPQLSRYVLQVENKYPTQPASQPASQVN